MQIDFGLDLHHDSKNAQTECEQMGFRQHFEVVFLNSISVLKHRRWPNTLVLDSLEDSECVEECIGVLL